MITHEFVSPAVFNYVSSSPVDAAKTHEQFGQWTLGSACGLDTT